MEYYLLHTAEYATVILASDWLYFSRHRINIYIVLHIVLLFCVLLHCEHCTVVCYVLLYCIVLYCGVYIVLCCIGLYDIVF